MGDECMVTVTHWQPKELAAPTDFGELLPGEQWCQWRWAATHRTFVQHLHIADGLVEDVGRKAAPHSFDFGKFGHFSWE